MTFGEKIKELRTSKGLTQTQLAATIGITQGFLGLIERGERKGHDAGLINRLAAALDVPLDSFAPYISPGVTLPPPPQTTEVRLTPIDSFKLLGTVGASALDRPDVFDEPRTSRRLVYPKGSFALEVTGTSCQSAGIPDGCGFDHD